MTHTHPVIRDAEAIAAAAWVNTEARRNSAMLTLAQAGRCVICGRPAWWTDLYRFATCYRKACNDAWHRLPEYLQDAILDMADYADAPVHIRPVDEGREKKMNGNGNGNNTKWQLPEVLIDGICYTLLIVLALVSVKFFVEGDFFLGSVTLAGAIICYVLARAEWPGWD